MSLVLAARCVDTGPLILVCVCVFLCVWVCVQQHYSWGVSSSAVRTSCEHTLHEAAPHRWRSLPVSLSDCWYTEQKKVLVVFTCKHRFSWTEAIFVLVSWRFASSHLYNRWEMGRIQFSCCHIAGQQCWKYLRTILSHLNFIFLDFMHHFRAKPQL